MIESILWGWAGESDKKEPGKVKKAHWTEKNDVKKV